MQPVASGFGPVALKMEFKKMRSDPVAFCDRLQNRTGPDFKTLMPNHVLKVAACQNQVSLVLLGGSGGQGARVEVSPDTSRA